MASRRWREPRGRGLPPTSGVQQAWADFTPAQLRAGRGSVDFTVPAELSLEGGQEVLFGFRFLHLGNADLAISAVDLHRKTGQERFASGAAGVAAARPPRQGRDRNPQCRLRDGAAGRTCRRISLSSAAGCDALSRPIPAELFLPRGAAAKRIAALARGEGPFPEQAVRRPLLALAAGGPAHSSRGTSVYAGGIARRIGLRSISMCRPGRAAKASTASATNSYSCIWAMPT